MLSTSSMIGGCRMQLDRPNWPPGAGNQVSTSQQANLASPLPLMHIASSHHSSDRPEHAQIRQDADRDPAWLRRAAAACRCGAPALPAFRWRHAGLNQHGAGPCLCRRHIHVGLAWALGLADPRGGLMALRSPRGLLGRVEARKHRSGAAAPGRPTRPGCRRSPRSTNGFPVPSCCPCQEQHHHSITAAGARLTRARPVRIVAQAAPERPSGGGSRDIQGPYQSPTYQGAQPSGCASLRPRAAWASTSKLFSGSCFFHNHADARNMPCPALQPRRPPPPPRRRRPPPPRWWCRCSPRRCPA